jgi:hypothetical protein
MLRLGGIDIHQLTGPVSFCYLAPKEEAFHRYASNGIFLPLVILLGDQHDGDYGRCEECEEEKGCYPVEGDGFLGALNRIAKTVPIDFFSETFTECDSIQQDRCVLNQVQSSTIDCWNVANRHRPGTRCRFRNVRWHKGDPRHAADAVENNVVVYQYLDYLVKSFTPGHYEILGNEIKPIGGDHHPFVIFLKTLKDSVHDTIEVFARKISRKISEQIIGNKKSLIDKQLRKSRLDINVELYIYRRIISLLPKDRLIKDHLLGAEEFTDELLSLASIGGEIDEDLEQYSSRLVRFFKQLQVFYIHSNAAMLDLYSVLRMLKKPSGSTNSYLAVGHFGNFHCTSIRDFLTVEMDAYEVIYDHPCCQSPLRCITFRKLVDVDHDLEIYSDKRQDSEEFLKVLRSEYQSRGENF